MKRKLFNLTLSLIFIFTMAAVVVPLGAAKVEAAGYGSGAYGGYASYDLSAYDVKYVAKYKDDLTPGSLKGDDTFDGTIMTPWRTITKAVNSLPYGGAKPDMIVVGRSDETEPYTGAYGGPPNDETIVIANPVTIVSMHGAPCTIIDVSGQGCLPAVVEIVSSDVIIDDFTIVSDGKVDPGCGADVGVWAHPTAVCDDEPCCVYLEDVKVLNCHIKIDEYDEGIGIEMFCVKWPVIDGCDIDVGTEGGEALSISAAWGIIMFECSPLLEGSVWHMPQVTNNELDVKGSNFACGIEMEACPKSLVGVMPDGSNGFNDIEVKAAADVMAFGIKAMNCPLIDIMYNLVSVLADGDYFAIAYGIKVWFSDRADVIANTVDVDVFMEGGDGGFLMARGISLKDSHESNVNDNGVTVYAHGNVSSEAMAIALEDDIAEDLAEFEPIILQSLGIDQSFEFGMGSAVGISIKNCMATVVMLNTVDVTLDMDIESGDEMSAGAGGGGCAIGISGLGSDGIQVGGNTVTVWDYVYTQVTAGITSTEFAISGAISVALGIILDHSSPGAVMGNHVNADADLKAVIMSGAVIATLAPDSALSRLESEILGGIYLQMDEALGDEAIDVALSGDLPGIQSLGLGGGIAVGIGIMAMSSDGVMISDNQPVSGTGDVTLDVYSYESVPTDPALAAGGGLGLGIGIAVIDCRGATVSGNHDVNGAGTAEADVGAQHGGIPMYAGAAGGGAGIGIGILLCGMHDYQMEAQDLPEDQCWPHRPVVVGNSVTATGSAAPINVSSADLYLSHEACAIGGGLGMAAGIAALWYPGILIQGNVVEADADAWVDVYSEAVHEFDPTSIGGAAAIGIGIATVKCFHAEILDNVASGDGIAYSEIGATEKVVMDANAFGGSLGLGIGILVLECPRSLVMGNSSIDPDTCEILAGVVGRGDAECVIVAESYIPLGDAHAFGLVHGIGIGIQVAFSPCTDVIRCNVAAGEGTARVSATYDADFGWAGACGVAASYDIMMKLMHIHPMFLEEEVDELDPLKRKRHRFGDVNYNSMVDDVPLGTNDGPIMVADAGLIKLGRPCLDATLNWWNHPTGPAGFGPGHGEPVIWIPSHHACPVEFMPWLYVDHAEVLCEQIGKFGFFIPMTKGLNTFSTPIALEEIAIPSRTWQNIWDNNPGLHNNVKWVLGWDSDTQAWFAPLGTDFVDPLYAYYIYMFSGANIILYVNSNTGHPYAMPIRDLPDGWSLIGPNPQWPPWPGMNVRPALTSILLTPAALPGYTQAISPNVFSQPPWVFVPTMPGPGPMMLAGRGYWVWMENLDTLVGFGFSPLPAGP